MWRIYESSFLVVLTLWLSSFAAPQTASKFQASGSKALCITDQHLYADKDGKPIWLETESLLKRAAHCKAPKTPAMARQLRVEGHVSVDISVNDTGKVECAQGVSGNPLFVGSAIDAIKGWTFRPMRQGGKAVWFYGHVRFHISTEIKKDENLCTVVGS